MSVAACRQMVEACKHDSDRDKGRWRLHDLTAWTDVTEQDDEDSVMQRCCWAEVSLGGDVVSGHLWLETAEGMGGRRGFVRQDQRSIVIVRGFTCRLPNSSCTRA